MAEEPPADCRNCGKAFPEGETPDYHGWCAACRQALVDRATRWAWIPTIAVAVPYLALLAWTGLFESDLLVLWLALGALLAFAAFKVGRRVAFDVVRSRGMKGGV